MSAATTAARNICIGTGGAVVLTTGSNNTMMGRSIAATLKTGSDNIIIGTFADVGTETDSRCIILGQNAKSTATDQFVLHSQTANAMRGRVTLVPGVGTFTVTPIASVTAITHIFLSYDTISGTPGSLHISARVPGTSFTIASTAGAADTGSTVSYLMVEP
jgi:hypothetical protein